MIKKRVFVVDETGMKKLSEFYSDYTTRYAYVYEVGNRHFNVRLYSKQDVLVEERQFDQEDISTAEDFAENYVQGWYTPQRKFTLTAHAEIIRNNT